MVLNQEEGVEFVYLGFNENRGKNKFRCLRIVIVIDGNLKLGGQVSLNFDILDFCLGIYSFVKNFFQILFIFNNLNQYF